MPSDTEVLISVVVIGYAPAPLLDACLVALSDQLAARPEVEALVVAHPTHQGSALSPLRERFRNIEWIEPPERHNVARMRGLGIARSRGATIALLEGDCIPASDWLARLATLRVEGALGGAVEPGRYEHLRDWGAYFAEFSDFMAPLPPRPVRLPGTNVVYRRDGLGDVARLEREGFYESFFHDQLGGALASDSSLVVRHERAWSARELVAVRFHHGRGYAGLRLAGRPLYWRLPYLLLAVLLPPVLVLRVVAGVVRRHRLLGRLALSLPWIALLALSWALGEFVGYLSGAGRSLERWR